MRQTDITALVAQLATMWQGDFPDEARLIWSSKLVEFDDDDHLVRLAFDACLEQCTYRPTWADFTTAYKAARTSALALARQPFTALPKAPHDGPNPTTRIKAELAARKSDVAGKQRHPHKPGDAVAAKGKTGIYIGMSPDSEWLRVNIDGDTHFMKANSITGASQ